MAKAQLFCPREKLLNFESFEVERCYKTFMNSDSNRTLFGLPGWRYVIKNPTKGAWIIVLVGIYV